MLSVHLFRILFIRYLWCALMDFYRTFVISASWDRCELVRFWGQKVKRWDYSVGKYVENTLFRVLFPCCLQCALMDFL